MATRKQRRRREKSFRHDYGFVVNDEEGNEVELAGSELRARKDTVTKAKPGAKPAASKQAAAKGTRRATRDPDPPSWRRSARRAALWCPAIVAVSYLFLRGLSVPERILHGARRLLGLLHPHDLLDGRPRLPPLPAPPRSQKPGPRKAR